MIIDTELSPNFTVFYTETVQPPAPHTARVRFHTEYFSEVYKIDLSIDDENSNISLIELVGSTDHWNTVLQLASVTYRAQFQSWYSQHT